MASIVNIIKGMEEAAYMDFFYAFSVALNETHAFIKNEHQQQQ
ncbi:hypothetical protein [Hydrotalea sp.]|nr:hypothetical protein [Hydrotalea sp.]